MKDLKPGARAAFATAMMERAIRKGVPRQILVGRILEMQHAVLLSVVENLDLDGRAHIDELNDACRSLLDAFWEVRK